MTSPTIRSLAWLRKQGFVATVVERWVPFPKPGHRVDLFNFADILYLHPVEGIGFVQVTDGSNMSKRRDKINNLLASQAKDGEGIRAVLAAGGTIELHGWARYKDRGKKRIRVELRREVIGGQLA